MAKEKEVKEAARLAVLKRKLEEDIKIYDKRIAAAKAQLEMVPQITATLNQSIGARLQCLETLKRLKDGK